MSTTSKTGGGSRASDDESRTAVKVGMYIFPCLVSNLSSWALIWTYYSHDSRLDLFEFGR